MFKLNISVAGTGRSPMLISSLSVFAKVSVSCFLLKAVQAPSMPSYLAQEKEKGSCFMFFLCVSTRKVS